MAIIAVAGHGGADVCGEEFEEFSVVRMASQVVFGVQNTSINDELVDTFAPGNELITFDDVLIVREHVVSRAHGAF